MSATGDLHTVGLIQDAALDPTLWPSVVERLVHQLDGAAGGLVVSDRRSGFTLASQGFDPACVRQYFDHYVHLDPMVQVRSPLGHPMISSKMLVDGVFKKSEFFNDWFAPQGFRDCLSAVVHRETERLTRIHIVPRQCPGDLSAREMDRFARILPFLIRALRVSQRLELLSDRLCAHQDALRTVAHAIMLLDRCGRLAFANPPAEKLLRAAKPLALRDGRLVACDAETNAVLQAAMARAMHEGGDELGGVQELTVPRLRRRPLMVSVVPISRRMMDRGEAGGQPAIMIMVVDSEVRPWSRLDGVVRAYGLTSAEGRVLEAIVDRAGLGEAADRLGIGRATVKTHLNRILAKTGTTRQSELIRLVAGSLPPLNG